MDRNTKLVRGDRVRHIAEDGSSPVWELMCDATEMRPDQLDRSLHGGDPYWGLHIRHVTAGTYDKSAVGDEGWMLVRLAAVEYIGRAGNPDGACDGRHH